jgi:hypothetical protein
MLWTAPPTGRTGLGCRCGGHDLEEHIMQPVTTVGLDIAKSVFQVHGFDAQGNAVVRRQLKRRRVLAFFKKLPHCLVGIEACAKLHADSAECPGELFCGRFAWITPIEGPEGGPKRFPTKADDGAPCMTELHLHSRRRDTDCTVGIEAARQ